jgi:hypothetical protein
MFGLKWGYFASWMIVLKIGLEVSEKSSFKWLFAASRCMWNLSVFKYVPFRCTCNISIVFCMVSNVCP